MAERRGLVKLFGKTFPVPAEGDIPAVLGEEGGGGNNKKLSNHKTAVEPHEKDQESPNSDEKSETGASSTASENPQETTPAKTSKSPGEEEEQNDTSNSAPEKTLKKPDKILPCPRCKSMDTKFCYYNNYNVNQPRHFCRNCQRYWTAGGTMRNVPVGAGRRKNKHSANHCRHANLSEATFQTVRSDIPERVLHPAAMKPNGAVLSFGTDTPLCESMASALNLAAADKTMLNCQRDGFHQSEEHIAPFSCSGGGVAVVVENGEEHSTGSSVTASNSTGDTLQEPPAIQGYSPRVPCYNGSPWPYPWNPAPAFCASSFPISFYPTTAYWGCAVPGAWSIPWPSPLSSSSSSSSSSPPNIGSAGSGPNSPALGKHSRDGNVLKQSNSEKGNALNKQTNEERCLWMPKTLRIDNPEEAAMSSIWTAIGIKNNKSDKISGGGLFKAFQPKAGIKNHTSETSQVLHANPAAMSRSLNFQESS